MDLNETLASRLAEIKTLIAELEKKATVDATAENPNWGHAGNLGYYVNRLHDILGHNG